MTQVKPSQILEKAARAHALRRLSAQALERFVGLGQLREYAPGDVVFREGDPVGEVLLILRGGLWLYKEMGDGERSQIAMRSDLEWLGEMSLDGLSNRSATAISESSLLTLVWSRDVFVSMLDEHHGAARDLLTYVSQHVRESDSALVEATRKRTHELLATNERLDHEVRRLRGPEGCERGFERFLGHSPAAKAARRAAARATRGDGPALIVGEPGSGRSLLARCIHDASARSAGPFSTLEVAGAPAGWTEAELLGAAPGAARTGREAGPGLLERSEGGTLYIDSIDLIAWPIQSVLVRFLATGCFERLGEATTRRADVRILCSMSTDPQASVREGQLRPDLAEELDLLRVTIPPLRTRRTDIPLLAAHLVSEEARRREVTPLELAPSALRVLSQYDFPGNLAELVAEIELLYTTLEPGSRVSSQDLGPRFVQGDPSTAEYYSEAVRAFKAQLISTAVREAGGNRARAAERLGLHRSNLTRMIRDLELDSVL